MTLNDPVAQATKNYDEARAFFLKNEGTQRDFVPQDERAKAQLHNLISDEFKKLFAAADILLVTQGKLQGQGWDRLAFILTSTYLPKIIDSQKPYYANRIEILRQRFRHR